MWGIGRSLSFEKLRDSFKRRSVDDGISNFVSRKRDSKDGELCDLFEDTPLQSEQRWRDSHAWSRNLETLASRYDLYTSHNNVAHRKSFEVLYTHRQVSKRHDFGSRDVTVCLAGLKLDLPINHYAQNDNCQSTRLSTLSKSVRQIDFWSDLAEKRHNVSENWPLDHLFPCAQVDKELAKASPGLTDGNRRVAPNWLDKCLDEMATILRNGGWIEEDVSEMITFMSPPLTESNWCLDGQSVLEGLLIYVDLLSYALTRAGWTARDVAEAIDVDLSLPDQKIRSSTLPPNRVAKIAKLTDSVALV